MSNDLNSQAETQVPNQVAPISFSDNLPTTEEYKLERAEFIKQEFNRAVGFMSLMLHMGKHNNEMIGYKFTLEGIERTLILDNQLLKIFAYIYLHGIFASRTVLASSPIKINPKLIEDFHMPAKPLEGNAGFCQIISNPNGTIQRINISCNIHNILSTLIKENSDYCKALADKQEREYNDGTISSARRSLLDMFKPGYIPDTFTEEDMRGINLDEVISETEGIMAHETAHALLIAYKWEDPIEKSKLDKSFQAGNQLRAAIAQGGLTPEIAEKHNQDPFEKRANLWMMNFLRKYHPNSKYYLNREANAAA